MEILGCIFVATAIPALLTTIAYMAVVIVQAIRSVKSHEKSQQKRQRCGVIVRMTLPSGLVEFERIQCENCGRLFDRLSYSNQNNVKRCPLCGFEFLEQNKSGDGDWLLEQLKKEKEQ